jgi:hypothetical protein
MLRVRARWRVRASFLFAVVALGLALSAAQGQASQPPSKGPATAGVQSSDGFLGTFADDQASVTLEPSTVGSAPPGVRSYAGTITGFGDTYRLTATSRDGTELTGQFESGGHAFALTAILSADALTLTTGGVRYLLARVGDPSDARLDDPRPAGLCDTPADQLRRGVPTYIESFGATDVEQVLGGILSVGADADGPWTASLTGRSYRLVNATNPSAVRFFYLMALPGEPEHGLTQGTTTMDLAINAETDFAGAGILFGFEPTTRHYHALVLTEGGYDLYRRDEDGLQNRLSVKTGAARVGASNRLEVMVEGGDMRLFLNDVSLACLGSDEPIAGGIGIIAIGTGTFDIEAFTYAPR